MNTLKAKLNKLKEVRSFLSEKSSLFINSIPQIADFIDKFSKKIKLIEELKEERNEQRLAIETFKVAKAIKYCTGQIDPSGPPEQILPFKISDRYFDAIDIRELLKLATTVHSVAMNNKYAFDKYLLSVLSEESLKNFASEINKLENWINKTTEKCIDEAEKMLDWELEPLMAQLASKNTANLYNRYLYIRDPEKMKQYRYIMEDEKRKDKVRRFIKVVLYKVQKFFIENQ